jgi:hypothetical protein
MTFSNLLRGLLRASPELFLDFWRSHFSIIILGSFSSPEKPGNPPFLLLRWSFSIIVLQDITEKPGLPASPLLLLRSGSPLEKVATVGVANLLGRFLNHGLSYPSSSLFDPA